VQPLATGEGKTTRTLPGLREAPAAWALPALLAAVPVLSEGLRTLLYGRGTWLWGDQALIDIEARDALVGRDLLGVYDRYGWHHPGPLWLILLGLFREVGGGSPAALIFGSYMVEAGAAVGLVYMAFRLGRAEGAVGAAGLGRSGRALAWWAALVVACYELALGAERLGTVWAPYAVALPTALLLLLLAEAATSNAPLAAAIGAVVCGSFLLQTDISTGVVVAVAVVAAALVRFLRWLTAPTREGRAWRPTLRALVPFGTALVIWLPPLVQQVTASSGNLSRLAAFLTSHPSGRSWASSVRAMDTVFGAFPLGLGTRSGTRDSDPSWLVAGPLWGHPWYLLYLAGTAAVAVVGLARQRRRAAALAGLTALAIAASGWSAHLAYGQLYPYLVYWAGALVVPALIAASLALVPASARGVGQLRLGLPAASAAAALAVTGAFLARPLPMTGAPSALGHRSWQAVKKELLRPYTHSVYVDIAAPQAMPEGAAVVDQAIRHGLRVAVDPGALYYFDPSFSPSPLRTAQVKVLVCCGKRDPGRPPPGMVWRGRVDGQSIYTAPGGYLVASHRRGYFFRRRLRD
jgi:hypothetical protein